MKQKHIDAYFKVAYAFADCSTAERLKVGAVVVKNHNILSIGYNGTPTGWDNTAETKDWMSRDAGGWLSPDEIEERWPHEELIKDDDGWHHTDRYRLKTKPEVIHAESNALMKLVRGSGGADGATMFCTHAPCMQCAKLIYQSGITTLYFDQMYRDPSGIQFLTKAGVEVHGIE